MPDVLSSFIEALKAQPGLLAMTVANIALLGFLYYALAGAAQSRDLIVRQVLDNSNAIHSLLNQRSVACPP